MEGILKGPVRPVTVKETQEKHVTSGVSKTNAPVNSEFYSYFNLDPIRNSGNEQIKYVHDWAMSVSKDAGHALKKINSIDTKLGSTSGTESRLGKIYNYLRMTNRLSSKKNEMENELAKIRERNKAMVKELKSMFQGKKEKIKAELDRVTMEYRKARSRYTQDASARSEAMKNEYYDQLKELEAMRDAYKGGR